MVESRRYRLSKFADEFRGNVVVGFGPVVEGAHGSDKVSGIDSEVYDYISTGLLTNFGSP